MRRWHAAVWRTRRIKTNLIYSSRLLVNNAPLAGTPTMEKYRLPLRRALYFLEEGTRLQEHFAECGKDMTSGLTSGEVHILQGDAARYAGYHCHHLLHAFRAERHRWTEMKELSFEDLTRVMEYIFYAALLLHVTALYETADKYCEALINVVFSGSIFLSKDVSKLYSANVVYQRYGNDRSRTSVETPSFPNGKRERAQKDEPWDSLHWAVVHFTHGISKWGLLDHTEPLLDMRQTTIPCCAMLRTFANITRSILTQEDILGEEEIRFLSYIATKEGSSRWLANPHSTVSSQSPVEGGNKEKNREGSICFSQQRRLQLLPLLWVALLARRSVMLDSNNQLCTARHALLRVLLLLGKEAKGDMVLTLLVKCLYFHSPAVRVSSVEMGVLLAQMEHHNVFSSSFLSSSSSSSSSCAGLFRLWMKLEIIPVDAPAARSRRAAYIAFRNIPLCTLQVVGSRYTSTRDGEAFVHELLLRALLQWSFRISENAVFNGELEELLLSAQHLVSLLECIKLRESVHKKEGASSLVVTAVFRAFAVRVAVICRENYDSCGTSYRTLLEFDKIVQSTLRQDVSGSEIGSVPCIYEKNRHQWLGNV